MNPVATPTCGFHYGLSYAEYAKWDAINFSRLKPIRDTASKCRYEIDHPKEPTPSMVLGSALHVAILEPARFEALFHICPPCDRRTIEGKEIFAKAEREAAGKLLIRQGDEAMGQVETVRGMAQSVLGLKAARPFISGAGQNEVAALWRDEETGLLCKGKMDRFLPEFSGLDGFPVIIEVKSTKDASLWGFSREVDNLGYAAQAACYCAAVKTIMGKMPVHIFIAVENFPPFDCAFHMTDDAAIQTGQRQYRQMLKRYAECVKKNEWPGYPDRVQVLSLPKYAHERKYED